MATPFLTAEWRNLLMANYEIDPAALKPYLPYQTELDDFNGIHYVSLVGFLFQNTKVLGVSFPFHTNFEEVNLRFYVRYKENGLWKRGVVFIKELVPKPIITFIANVLYKEHYATHKMEHQWQTSQNLLQVAYRWKVGNNWNFIKATADKESKAISPGSEEEFITEHYWGYTYIDRQKTGEYEVTHPKWNIHEVQDYAISCSADVLYGAAFAETINGEPRSVLLAEGSPIKVMKGKSFSF